MILYIPKVELVLDLHDRVLEIFGGSKGVRDMTLIESAVESVLVSYGGKFFLSFEEMAAKLLYKMVKNHGFVDGNKRTAALTSLWFVRENDHRLEATQMELYDVVADVASGVMSEQDLITFYKDRLVNLRADELGDGFDALMTILQDFIDGKYNEFDSANRFNKWFEKNDDHGVSSSVESAKRENVYPALVVVLGHWILGRSVTNDYLEY